MQKDNKREEIFHSSGYGAAQSGGGVGAASGESFAQRQAIEKQRRFVQGYKNSQIMRQQHGLMRAKTYTPRTEGGTGAVADTRGYGRNAEPAKGYGRTEGPKKAGYGRTEGVSKPRPIQLPKR